ncbi:hypothetical protein M501DRAFT_967571 [Patellaria atrata CBS 101060]|uniref:Glycine-rich domain-containing protein 1 n=1 Tax=Patellaria atrata CBS 101060 TaxID=1346257 RepID=A0A9P4SL21_9PEZI|nr:hypothetical protein M501DRAFT_967571 [Patellaria atrata CBS 101060]
MALAINSYNRKLHELSKESLNAIKGVKTYWYNTHDVWKPTEWPTAATKDEEPKIPSPDIFADLTSLKGTTTDKPAALPTIAQCAVHLELLETFHVLRQKMFWSIPLDKAFDVKEEPRIVHQRDGSEKKLKDDRFAEKRNEKWTKFVTLAVYRFLVWWDKIDGVLENTKDRQGRMSMGSDHLPPLDVLMVWHSFLLNTGRFKKMNFNRNLYKINFPWEHIHNAIDNSKWEYTLLGTARTNFTTLTGLQQDLYSALETDPTAVPRTLVETVRLSPTPTTADQSLVNDLASMVARQTSFIDKMDRHLWIRSPAFAGTMARSLTRYSRFLTLFRLYPGTMLVPTLDIDIAWHTHQLTPSLYLSATQALCGRFINHDDSIAETGLSTGLADTKRVYRERFCEDYELCSCWDCEMLLSALEGRHEVSQGEPGIEELGSRIAEEIAYYRMVEFARRNGKPLPKKRE